MDFTRFFKAPSYGKAAAFDFQEGVFPVFYNSGRWKGGQVKSFAWLGVPKAPKGRKCPGMVLVHGGGGTAFPDWVRLWNSRGYAAIAMDVCGGVPAWSESPYCRPRWPRHSHSGPAGWGCFKDAMLPPEEQWPYHAVSAIVAAHSLLRSLQQVDSGRIGLTGISWGGILSSIVAGVDSRFAFAAPVYGCGFLDLANFNEFKESSPSKNKRWLKLWDPAHYLPKAKMPLLWVNGTNDFAFQLPSTMKSAAAAPGKSSLCLPVRMVHGHGGAGEKPEEIHNFANKVLKHGKSLELPEFSNYVFKKGSLSTDFSSSWKPAKAELNWTEDSRPWKDRLWKSAPAKVKSASCEAKLPAKAVAAYFNVFSESGLLFSSPPLLEL